MAELLFEIFSEEIPARMQVRAGGELVRLMDAALKDAGLSPNDSHVLTGPRRLTYITDVETRSPDVSEERKGPRVGAPDRAIEGFMRGAGLDDIAQAETRSDKKGDYYVAMIHSEGRDTADILRDAIPAVMNDFPWPKSMTSGESDFRWVRPLRGLTVLLDGRSLDGIEVGGIASDNLVHGHRQMGPGPFAVATLADYKAALDGDGHVMAERKARQERILDQACTVCSEAGLELVEDEGLLDEVTGLVEWPVALLGDMDPDFLELPDEVIRLTLKSHQKTFTVRNEGGQLAPHFVIIANLETPDDGATIKAGNAKVISARLSDARFFQEEDRKRKLQDYHDDLKDLVFHKKLGSMHDKAERVAALAREIAPHVGANPILAEKAARLAKCDLVTQTVIEMTSLQGKVGRWIYEHDVTLGRADSLPSAHPDESRDPADAEASDLDPGVRRGEREWGEADHHAIAVAIEDHYKPQGPSDAVPTEPVAVAVALADKIDTLVGFWAIDEKPTGSKDPYALRRAALGVIRLIASNSINYGIDLSSLKLPLRRVFRDADNAIRRFTRESLPKATLTDNTVNIINEWERRLNLYGDIGRSSISDIEAEIRLSDPEPMKIEADVHADVSAFLKDRLHVYLRGQGHRHDVIDAVIAQGGDDLLAISRRVEALGMFLLEEDGEDLVQGYKRAANILRAEEKKTSKPSARPDGSRYPADGSAESGAGSQIEFGMSGVEYSADEARLLAEALTKTRPAIDAALEAADYPAALSALADLREPIDEFFEAVVVNSDDPDERARRLGLLSAVVETFHRIADFSRLDG
ncbi:glycine--tRNA ligase subunit beta [uncultured Algimonas sp.]|uniref:glycine--tRNA ligase subunit beta n=1 Tax=uncultured Algimonas sp. TaxID=1547920 RepID=UPI00261FC864|nr:glycine--tRNA ligase subunit beta [uncultured Algimonas sp.]